MSIARWMSACVVLGLVAAVPPAAWPQTIQEQGAECAKEIGAIPTDLGCLAGTVIPLTNNDNPINHYDASTQCDRPPLLGDASEYGNNCVPYSRLQVKGDGVDVFWTLLCRRYQIRDSPTNPLFEDIALIGHKKSTGATCFFQALKEVSKHSFDGTSVPAPTASGAETFWMTPVQTNQHSCYICHDNDPFIHTPYVDQVQDQNKVPGNPKGKYKFVPFVNQNHQWPVPQYFDVSASGNKCAGCHRMGTGNSSDEFTKYSTGQDPAPNVTASYNQWKHSYWMPKPNPANSVLIWNNDYGTSVTQVGYCYNNPTDTACHTKDVPQVVSMAPWAKRGLKGPEVFVAEIESCQMMGYKVAFAKDVPYNSAAFVDDKCSCGVRDGVSPEDARKAGWFAQDTGGTCTCGFKAGGDAENACRKP